MAVDIRSPNFEITIGYIGFMKLRQAIAELCPGEIRDHYLLLTETINHFTWDEEQWAAYDRRTDELYDKYGKSYGKVLDFLYATDCGAELSYGTCKQLLNVIGDYDNDIVYCQYSHNSPVMFKDFKNILIDCYKNKQKLKWS